MAKRKITAEGFFDKVRKHLQKTLDDRLAKKLDDLYDNPSADVKRAAVKASKAYMDLEEALDKFEKNN